MNLKPLYDKLKDSNTPLVGDCIYLSEGLYITPEGDVIEEELL